MKPFFFFLAITISSSSFAQNTFFKTFGGTSNDICASGDEIKTGNKGFLINGYTNSFGSGGNDGYLVRLDYSGNLVWSKTIGGNFSDAINAVVSKSNGQIIVGGGYAFNSSNSSTDAFVGELDSMGNLLWSKTYGNASGLDNVTILKVASNNEILITGLSESIQPGGMRDVTAMKLSSTGNVIWSRVFGGFQNDWGRDIWETTNGYFIVGNTFSYGAGQHDGFLTKLDNSGNISWMKVMGTSNEDQFMNMTIANNGDPIIGAFTVVNGTRHGWIQRVNSAGNQIWSKSYFVSGYQPWAKIIKANDGNILMFASEVVNNGKLVILKINQTTGAIIWAKEYGGSGRDVAQGFFQSTDGGINAIGITDSYSTNGDEDLFILRTDANGNMGNCNYTDVTNIFNSSNFSFSTQNVTPQQQTNIPSVNTTLTISTPSTASNIVCEGIEALFTIQNPVICVGECTDIIDNSSGAANWNWSFQGANIASSSIQNPTNICYNTVGIYDIELIITNGSLSDTLVQTITVTDIPNVNLGADTTICTGENLQLDATTNNGSYLWSTGETTASIQTNQAGTYSVEVTVGTCIAYDTIIINIFNSPVVDLGVNTSFCDVNAFILNAFNPIFTNYEWQDNSNLSVFTASNTGNYSVTVTDQNGCQGADTINLGFYNTPIIDLGNDTIICQFQSITLDAFSINASYLWNDGTMNSTLLVEEAGNYTVMANNEGCKKIDSISIEVISTPSIFLGMDTFICDNNTILLTVEDSTAIDYTWQDGSNSPSFTVESAGTYSVFVNYNSGCFNSDTINFLPELPIYLTLPTDTFFCKNKELTLNAYQENALSYQWEGRSAYWGLNDYKSSNFVVNFEGNYNVTINNGCSDVIQTVYIVEEDCGCYPFIPNAFTPNNDGNNDAFQVYNNCPITNYELKIFDRWGGLAFQTNDINEHWDGTVNGEAVQGVYVWMLNYETLGSNGELETRLESGDVTVLR